MVQDRISLLFLPAFVRVAAVVVAKLAGLLGLFLGSLVIGLLYGDSLWIALGNSFASAAGIFCAYWVLCTAMRTESLPMTLPILVVLTALYSPINAMLHAFAWQWLGLSSGITALEISLMMAGDILGVIAMFFLIQLVSRAIKKLARRAEV